MNAAAIREYLTRTAIDAAALVEELENVYQAARAIDTATAERVKQTQWFRDRVAQVEAYEAGMNASREDMAKCDDDLAWLDCQPA